MEIGMTLRFAFLIGLTGIGLLIGLIGLGAQLLPRIRAVDRDRVRAAPVSALGRASR